MELDEYRCDITGVSLALDRAVIVIYLQINPDSDDYSPIALPLKGAYPSEGREESANDNLIVRFFINKQNTGEFTGEDWESPDCLGPIGNRHQLLQYLFTNEEELNGQRVALTLISETVWDEIVRDASRPTEPVDILFHRLFAETSIAAEIYDGSITEVADEVIEMWAVKEFLSARKPKTYFWGSSYGTGEVDREAMWGFIQEARQEFKDSAAILRALDHLARKFVIEEAQAPRKIVRETAIILNPIVHGLIERIDRWLAVHRYDYYIKLQPGVTDVQLDAFEKRFALTLPTEFRQLYRWRNGQQPSNNKSSLQGNRMFMDLEDVTSYKEMMDGFVGYDFDRPGWWHFSWIPFLTNGGGSHLCLDVSAVDGSQPGNLVAFWKADEDRPVEYSSMQQWLAELVASMENGSLELL